MPAFTLHGHAAELFDCEDKEVLCAGPARCGKTHSELVKALVTAEKYPGSRQLFARETRKSLTETVLADWEVKILGPGHPVIGKKKRNNRDAYHWPNGSAIVLHGLDDVNNVLSGEFDRIYVFQAEQMPKADDWNALLSRLSGTATPYRQAVLDVNPAGADHWIIRRARETICLACATVLEPPNRDDCQRCGSVSIGRMRHLKFHHSDNPLLFDHERGIWRAFGVEYLSGILGRLRGAPRKRLLEGEWVSEEGLVLEEYDPEVHRISGRLEQLRSGAWTLTVTSPGWQVGAKDPLKEAIVHLEWFGAGFDWGYTPAPGVLQVWGYDRYGRRFRVREVYQTKKQMEWWAAIAEGFYRDFRMRYIACDPSCNAQIDLFNMRLGPLAGRSSMIAIGADNTIRRQNPDLAGIDLMRWGLKDPSGMVRTYLLKDARVEGEDRDLRDAGQPTCTEEEIPRWVFDKRKSDDRVLEKPDEDCPDHGLDAWRYEVAEGFGRRKAAGSTEPPKYREGTAGHVHRHAEKMAKARAWREANG